MTDAELIARLRDFSHGVDFEAISLAADRLEQLAKVEEAARRVDAEHELIAGAFHEAYERLAPEHGYETRKESAVPWEDVPEKNRTLMIAVVSDLIARNVIALADRLEQLANEAKDSDPYLVRRRPRD